MLDIPTPASQIRLKPLCSWHSAMLTAKEAASHEAARQKQKEHELEIGKPLLWKIHVLPPCSGAEHQPMVPWTGLGRARL